MSRFKNFAIIFFLIALITGTVFFLVIGTNSPSDLNVFSEGKIETVSGLPENYDSFKLQINGKLYNMPLSVEKIEKLGFRPAINYDNREIAADTLTTDTYEYYSSTDESKIEIGFYNPLDETKKVKNCKISSLLVKKTQLKDNSVQIVFPGGIQIGSTFQKVKNAYGKYSNIYKDENYTVYTWQSENQNMVKIHIDNKTNRVSEMFMQKVY